MNNYYNCSILNNCITKFKLIKTISRKIVLASLFLFGIGITSISAGNCDWNPTGGDTTRGVCVFSTEGYDCETEVEFGYYNCTIENPPIQN
jgi:hypothetical protein